MFIIKSLILRNDKRTGLLVPIIFGLVFISKIILKFKLLKQMLEQIKSGKMLKATETEFKNSLPTQERKYSYFYMILKIRLKWSNFFLAEIAMEKASGVAKIVPKSNEWNYLI